MRELLVATADERTLTEFRHLFGHGRLLRVSSLLGRPFVEPRDDWPEGASLEEEAARVAMHIARRSGMPTVAERSGLFVDALGGGSGYLLSPIGNEDARLARVLANMHGLPDEQRGARLMSVLAFVVPHPVPGYSFVKVVRGEVAGRVAHEVRGRPGHGHGYSRLLLDESGQSLAWTERLAPDERAQCGAPPLPRELAARQLHGNLALLRLAGAAQLLARAFSGGAR